MEATNPAVPELSPEFSSVLKFSQSMLPWYNYPIAHPFSCHLTLLLFFFSHFFMENQIFKKNQTPQQLVYAIRQVVNMLKSVINTLTRNFVVAN